jgi:hypothetical protein
MIYIILRYETARKISLSVQSDLWLCVCSSANNFVFFGGGVKVNFALEQAMKYNRGSIGIVVLFL